MSSACAIYYSQSVDWCTLIICSFAFSWLHACIQFRFSMCTSELIMLVQMRNWASFLVFDRNWTSFSWVFLYTSSLLLIQLYVQFGDMLYWSCNLLLFSSLLYFYFKYSVLAKSCCMTRPTIWWFRHYISDWGNGQTCLHEKKGNLDVLAGAQNSPIDDSPWKLFF